MLGRWWGGARVVVMDGGGGGGGWVRVGITGRLRGLKRGALTACFLGSNARLPVVHKTDGLKGFNINKSSLELGCSTPPCYQSARQRLNGRREGVGEAKGRHSLGLDILDDQHQPAFFFYFLLPELHT